MRSPLLFLPLALAASPALAQAAPPVAQLPPEMTDPRIADRIADAMSAMSKAFLNLPVGEVQAAMEGRQPTQADRRRTVRTETGMNERELEQKMQQVRPAMEASQRAMAAALPAMMKAMSEVQREIERATANMPQPGYPKR